MENNKMFWVYMIHLSSNMWGDVSSSDPFSRCSETLDTEEEAWQEVTSFLPECGFNTLLIDLGDGVQYESHPEISVPGAWSKEKLKKELGRLRSMGITPVPKLNFSAAHDNWLGIYGRMVSTPTYYKVCKDLIDEVTELFDSPEIFHLGLDEETYRMQETYSYAVIRNGELWWHDADYLFRCCNERGTRPWVWADRYWDHPEDYLSHMSKDVLQSNWYYWPMKRKEDGSLFCESNGPEAKAIQAYLDLDKAGYDQIPTSSTWNFKHNSYQTMELGKECLSPEHLKGYMTASWMKTIVAYRYGLMNDALNFKEARKKLYSETF